MKYTLNHLKVVRQFLKSGVSRTTHMFHVICETRRV